MSKFLRTGGVAALIAAVALLLWFGYQFRPVIPEVTATTPAQTTSPDGVTLPVGRNAPVSAITPSSKEKPQASNEPQASRKLRVALVISGTSGDQGFVDLVLAGVERAEKDLGLEVRKSATPKPTDWEPELKAAVDAGYNLIIVGDSQMRYAVADIARVYPDVGFIMLGESIDSPNVLSVRLEEEEGAFLAGALAAMVVSEPPGGSVSESSLTVGTKPEKVVGWIGGPENDSSRKIAAAYRQGALHADKEVKVLSAFSGSFGEPDGGKEVALRQLAAHAGVIAAYARGTNPGIVAAVRDAGKKVILGEPARTSEDAAVMANVTFAVDDVVYDLLKSTVSGKLEVRRKVNYGLSTGHIRVSVNGASPKTKARLDEISDALRKRELRLSDGAQ